MQPRRLTTWLSASAIVALFSLSACTTPAFVCPPLKEYDTDWHTAFILELERLDRGNFAHIDEAIVDYYNLRNLGRVCQ